MSGSSAEPRMIKIVSNDVILSKLILAALAAPNDSPVLITGVSFVDPSGTDAADVATTIRLEQRGGKTLRSFPMK